MWAGRQEGVGGGGRERAKYMYLTFGFVVWRVFLLSLDDIVGVVAALSFGLWVLHVDDDGCWDEVWRGMICVLEKVWIQ